MSVYGEDEPDTLFRVALPPRPYPGLRPYEKEEWPVFFGRERMADEITERLVRERLLVVHGDSGCGKSSLIRAGVLPQLEQESARGGVRWRTCLAVPGEAPLWHIAEALAGLSGRVDEADVIGWRSLLNFGRESAAAVGESLRERYPGDYVCLLIDQFEELFDHVRRHGPDEARLLTGFLVGLHEERPEGLCAIVTMRSEFLGVCSRYGDFAGVVNKAQYLLPAMGRADLMRSIREPATLFNGEVSRDLAERLIVDAGGEGQDQLPLVQHGLMVLCEPYMSDRETTPWRLEAADYRHPRGLAGMLSDHADDIAEAARRAWPPRDTTAADRLVEDMFRTLTDINDGQAIRRRRTLAQVAAETGTEMERVAGVADMFRAEGVSFIRPYGREPLAPDSLLDISHEALIRCWGKIAEKNQGWLAQEFRNGLIWRALLVQADSFGRNPKNILSAATAEERQAWLRRRNAAWAERYGGGWDQVQRLVDASVEAAEAGKEDERRALLEAARRRSRKRMTWVASAFSVVSLVLAGLALIQAWKAEEQRALAVEQSSEAEKARATAEQQRLLAEEARRTAEQQRLLAEEARRTAEQERSAAEEARQSAEDAYAQEKAAQESAIIAQQRASRVQDSLAQTVQQRAKDEKSVDSILDQLERTQNPYELAVLAQGVVQGSEALSPSQVARLADTLLRALKASSESSARAAVAQAIVPLAAKLSADQAAGMFEQVLAAAKSETDRPTRQALQAAGTALAERLPQIARSAALRDIGRVGADATQGAADRLIATIPLLEAPDINVRKIAVQDFVSALRDGTIPSDEQPMVAGALVDALGKDLLQTAKGRYNLLFILRKVPAATWRKPGWDEVARSLRANIAVLEKRAEAKETQISADARQILTELAQQLK